MNSAIFISGVALWVLLALLIILAIAFLVIGCSYINSERERAELKMKKCNLQSELSLCQAELNVCKLKRPQMPQK